MWKMIGEPNINWNKPGTPQSGRACLIQLAQYILSLTGNSASVETLFSVFGNTHTKLRNRLSVDKTHMLTIVRQHRVLFHKQSGSIVKRPKRHFDSLLAPPSQPSDAQLPPGVIYEDELEQDHPTCGLSGACSELLSAAAAIQLPDSLDELDTTASTSYSSTIASTQYRPHASSHSFVFRKIKLCDLFNYPPTGTPQDKLASYWHFDYNLLDDVEDAECRVSDCTDETP
jgi:hypothetical protein